MLAAVAALLPAAPASAHSITPTITPPTSPQVEDSGFAIGFSGDVTSLSDGEGELFAKIRPVGGTPCAPTWDSDPGASILSYESVQGSFSDTATYTAPAPGDYLVCAWLGDGFLGSDSGPPASSQVTVRPAILQISATAPATVRQGVPFAVTVSYRAEVPRYLTVLVSRASSCSVSSDALRGISASTVEVADDTQVSGSGSVTGTVRIDDVGTYLICGFMEEEEFGTAAAELVTHAATFTVSPRAPALRSCGNVGGRRHIQNVRARNVSCGSATSVARRWGSRRRAPRQLGPYRCFAQSGVVTCTAGSAQVRFRFGHL